MSSNSMLNLNHFSAWITVDHRRLSQYGTEFSPDGRNATCYIASEAGKKFTVHWKDTSTYRPCATTGRVSVDGIDCGGKVIASSSVAPGPGTTKRNSVTTGPKSIREFTFGKLEVTDDDRYLDSKASHNVGEIVLSIWRVATGPSRERSHGRRIPTEEEQKVHEKSKKATAHRIKLGDEIRGHRRRTITVKDMDQEPRCVFTFRYRPLDVLRANNIAPPAASTSKKRPAIQDDNESSDGFEIVDVKPDILRSQKKAKRISRTDSKSGSMMEIIDLT